MQVTGEKGGKRFFSFGGTGFDKSGGRRTRTYFYSSTPSYIDIMVAATSPSEKHKR